MAPRPLNRKNIQGPETYKERKELDQLQKTSGTHTHFSTELLPAGLRIRIQSGQWIRIRIQEGKMTHKSRKNLEISGSVFSLKCWIRIRIK
jgi:hypothetical protein